jgi:hypothetical protein
MTAITKNGKGVVMAQTLKTQDKPSACPLGDRALVLDFSDGQLDFYRIRAGELELYSTRWAKPRWRHLTPEDILQHLIFETPVAEWLHDRIRLEPQPMAAAA